MNREVLWRWRDACAAVGVSAVDGPDVSGISIDTRSLQPGDLFVALRGDPGPRFNTDSRTDRDGHDFIGDAQARGAVGALTQRPTGTGFPELRVDDTLDGLWALGRAALRLRHRFSGGRLDGRTRSRRQHPPAALGRIGQCTAQESEAGK